MRRTCLVFILALYLTACSEPQCLPGETRVGTMCRSLPADTDGAVVDSDDSVGSVATRDASTNGQDARADAPPPQKDDAGSDAGSAIDPETRLDALPGGPPSFQFRADTVTANGGRVSALPNLRGSDALVVTAGTLLSPASDAALAGAPSISFTGTQWLDSNLPASAWRFLHDGSGCEVFTVFVPASNNTSNVLVTTTSGSGGTGFITQYNAINQAKEFYVQNGMARPVRVAVLNTYATGVATYADDYHGMASSLQYAGFHNETLSSAGSYVSPVDTVSNPKGTLRLGAYVDNAFPLTARWSETLIFTRILREPERQVVREYIAARYGIAEPPARTAASFAVGTHDINPTTSLATGAIRGF